MNLKHELSQFIGTSKWTPYRILGRTIFRYTDGIEYLIEKADAKWLVDLIASYQVEKRIFGIYFQIWTLTVDLNKKSGVLIMRQDTNAPVEIKEEIQYTDFPLDEIKIYLIDSIMLLPSEY